MKREARCRFLRETTRSRLPPIPPLSSRWASPMTIAAPILKNTPVPRGGLPAGLTKSVSPRSAPLAAAAAAARASRAGPPADFFNVRLHPDAAEVTAPLQARAVTRGQDIFFHPGQYQPGTPRGRALIAHELAHTLQTRQDRK